MGQKGSRKSTKFWQKEGFSFLLSLISVSIVFIFIGYLMGQYGLKMLEERSYATSFSQQPSDLNLEIENKLEQLSSGSEPEPTKSSSQPNNVPQQIVASGFYKVQVGAFSQQANAQRLVNSLKELGYEAIITSGPPYRVQTGAFSSSENAQRYAAELQQQGFEVTIVRP